MARSPARSPRAVALIGLAALAACATAPKPAPPVPPAPVASVAPSASAPPVVASASSSTGSTQPQPRLDPVQAKLCTEGELRTARDEFRSIHQAMVRDAVDEATAKLQRDRVLQLLESPCYGNRILLHNLELDDLRKAASVQFKAWWRHGGESIVSGPLSHANAAYFAPSVPRVLAFETLAANDPLRAIVCPSDAVCDPLAEGARLDLSREVERVVGPHQSDLRRSVPSSRVAEGCAREASAQPESERLLTYLSCVGTIEPDLTVLPTAHYRSPKGWLVMRGRRGHYQFCDEIRAYDLATGAAYIASRCAGLVLKNDGHVDQGKTSQQSQMQTQVGTLSIEALRRLSLMLWLKDSLVEDQHVYAHYPLPEGVPMPDPSIGFGWGSGHGGGWGSSAQTRIAFSIVDGGQLLRADSFTWPDSSDAAEQIIDDLLVTAEATFQPGCAPAALPANLAQARAFGGVSALDASVESLRASAEALGKAMADLKPGKNCRK